MTEKVLLAGATGMLGSHIALHLLSRPGVRVRLLVRDPGGKTAALEPLVSCGAELIEGDLADWPRSTAPHAAST